MFTGAREPLAQGVRRGTHLFNAMPGIHRTSAGSLAGSTLSMAEALRNLVRLAGVPLPAALRMAAENPARALGVLDRKGTLAPGKDADVVVLDADLSVVLTVARGYVIHRR